MEKKPRAEEEDRVCAYVVCREVRWFSDEDLGKGYFKFVWVRLVCRPHALNERLAGFLALCAVVVPAIRGEDTFLQEYLSTHISQRRIQ